MGDTKTKGPYTFTPQELKRVESWFQDVRDASGDPNMSEKEILLLYAGDKAMRPKA